MKKEKMNEKTESYKELQAKFEDSQQQLSKAQSSLVNQQIDGYLANKESGGGMDRVIKVMAKERVKFNEKGEQIFLNEEGEQTGEIYDMRSFITSLEDEGIVILSKKGEQKERPVFSKSKMTEAQKKDFKAVHGYKKYNSLPYQ